MYMNIIYFCQNLNILCMLWSSGFAFVFLLVSLFGIYGFSSNKIHINTITCLFVIYSCDLRVFKRVMIVMASSDIIGSIYISP